MTQFVFFDDGETPTYHLRDSDTWRPERGDMSWRIEDANGRSIDEYHPPKPRHARHVQRLPITPFITSL